jgi:hypothetical protein
LSVYKGLFVVFLCENSDNHAMQQQLACGALRIRDTLTAVLKAHMCDVAPIVGRCTNNYPTIKRPEKPLTWNCGAASAL